MSNLLKSVCLLVMLAAALYVGALMLGETGDLPTAGTGSAPTDATASDAAPDPEMGVDQPLVVDLQIGESAKAQLVDGALDGERTLIDQYRDWLLFATVSALLPSATDVSEVLLDLPASRQGYMRGFGTFEFGVTRSRPIGPGLAVGLIPAGLGAQDRKDHLAQIADEQRKNLAGDLERLIVVEYRIDARAERATLTRRPDLDAATLFSADYGYREATVSSAAELSAFLRGIDDITRIARGERAGTLLLGGRKVLARAYRGIGTEHIASIWQSEAKLAESRRERDRKLDEKRALLNALVQSRSKTLVEAQHEYDAFAEQVILDYRKRGLTQHSGFSLDPVHDFAGLGAALRNAAPVMRASAPEASAQIAAAVAGVQAGKIVPLLEAVDELKAGSPAVADFLKQLEREHSFQKARYDGELQGTEVGMILFYTDLLAKLWTIDFINSAPTRTIPGFVTDILSGQKLSPVYDREADALPSARLWFGVADSGYQLAEGGTDLLFGRRGTRIYSAGSNPLRPGEEVQTSALLSASTDWWNDHYDEVAAYESQYERLNQIMKWSIAIVWLNEDDEGSRLGYLSDVAVERSHRLPRWVEAQRDLRFTNWQRVGFLPPGQFGVPTETMPLLSSPAYERRGRRMTVTGGVSLAERASIVKHVARPTEKLVAAGNVDHAASVAGKLVTFDKAVFTRTTGTPARAVATAEARAEAKLRGSQSQLAKQAIERVVLRDERGIAFQTRLGEAPLGDLQIGRTRNGFAIAWKGRDLDRASALAADLSTTRNPRALLTADPRIEALIEIPAGKADSYAVRFKGSKGWALLAVEEAPAADIAAGWMARSARTDGRAVYQTRLVSGEEVLQAAGPNPSLVVDQLAGRPFVRLEPAAARAPRTPVELDTGNGRLSGFVGREDGLVRLPAAETASVLGGDLGRLPTLFGQRDLAALRDAARAPGPRTLALEQRIEPARLAMRDTMEAGDLARVAASAAENPRATQRAMQQRVLEEAQTFDALVARGRAEEAALALDDAIRVTGREPDLLLRRALHRVAKGQPEAGLEVGDRMLPRLRDPNSLFAEINRRLRAAASDGVRQDLGEMRTFAAMSERARTEIGHPVLTAERGRLEAGFMLRERPRDAVRALDGIPADATVYVVDHPSLANLDWQAGFRRPLATIMNSDLGTVVRLPTGTFGEFRPSTIFLPDTSAAAGRTPARVKVRLPPAAVGTEDCTRSGANCDKDREVYLVVPKAA